MCDLVYRSFYFVLRKLTTGLALDLDYLTHSTFSYFSNYKMTVTWGDSGKGPVEITLLDAQHLAVEAGFVFTVDETAPLSKRANLQSKRFHIKSGANFLNSNPFYILSVLLQKCSQTLASIPFRHLKLNSPCTRSTQE